MGADGISIAAAGADGAPVARVESLAARPVERSQLDAARAAGEEALFRVDWAAVTLPSEAVAARDGLALIGGDAERLATLLTDAGAAVSVHSDVAALLAAVEAGDPAPGLIVAAASSAAPEAAGGGGVVGAARLSAAELLPALQALVADARLADSRLAAADRGRDGRPSGRGARPRAGRDLGPGALGPVGAPRPLPARSTATAATRRRRRWPPRWR